MIQISLGNIVTQDTDAIVNAANERLLAGSGVSGAIHAAVGSRLEDACRQLGGCPTGEARITKGFNLPAAHIIHAVAPRYFDGTRGEAALLRKTYKAIFEICLAHKLKSVAIPAIGTGVYRFPLIEATEIAFDVARIYKDKLLVRFICFDQRMLDLYTHISLKITGHTSTVDETRIPLGRPDYFVKIIAMLQQNWAVIENTPLGTVRICFLTDHSEIFDEMSFPHKDEAQQALIRNGFKNFSLNPELHEFLRPPPPPFRDDPSMRRPIYSSGQFWQT